MPVRRHGPPLPPVTVQARFSGGSRTAARGAGESSSTERGERSPSPSVLARPSATSVRRHAAENVCSERAPAPVGRGPRRVGRDGNRSPELNRPRDSHLRPSRFEPSHASPSSYCEPPSRRNLQRLAAAGPRRLEQIGGDWTKRSGAFDGARSSERSSVVPFAAAPRRPQRRRPCLWTQALRARKASDSRACADGLTLRDCMRDGALLGTGLRRSRSAGREGNPGSPWQGGNRSPELNRS